MLQVCKVAQESKCTLEPDLEWVISSVGRNLITKKPATHIRRMSRALPEVFFSVGCGQSLLLFFCKGSLGFHGLDHS